jgi:glycosyltransferase involved in cell wall biosynthesis
MKILLINKFLYPKGGDAIATLQTGKLLTDRGHQVSFWGMDHPQNPDYPLKRYFIGHRDYTQRSGISDKIRLTIGILYSVEAKRKLEQVIEIEKPDIIHLNNFAHQISPSILDTIVRHKIPSVMTMTDFKMVCPVYSLYRNGKPCELCRNRHFYNCVFNRCTKKSFSKSMINTIEMYLHHSLLHIYGKVDCFISPSKFLMSKLKNMGFQYPIRHLPNFVDTNILKHLPTKKNQDLIVYIGRLSPEKGLHTLIDAIKKTNAGLRIIGDGPMREELEKHVSFLGLTERIHFLGYRNRVEITEETVRAIASVCPSVCYENNPLSVIESFALSVPVLGSRIGGIPELVKDGETGYTFEPGNIADLSDKIRLILSDPVKAEEMGHNGRQLAIKSYDAAVFYPLLMEIYADSIKKHGHGTEL